MRKVGKLINKKLRELQVDALSEIIVRAKNKKDAKAILVSLLSPSERNSIAQRLALILKISEGECYADIQAEYGSSPSTITKATDFYLKNTDLNSTFNNLVKDLKAPSINNDDQKTNTKMTKPHYPGAIKL